MGISKKEQSLLSNGYQSSGNIFLIDHPAIQNIRAIIETQINLYRTNSDPKVTLYQIGLRIILYMVGLL